MLNVNSEHLDKLGHSSLSRRKGRFGMRLKTGRDRNSSADGVIVEQ
jgi:hypothetical protein